MIPGKKYRLEDVLRAGWRRKWQIVLPAALIAVGTVAITPRLPARYRSEALLQWLDRSPSSDHTSSNSPGGAGSQPSAGATALATIGREVMTRARLQKVIRDLDLYPERRRTITTESLVDLLRTDIAFEPVDHRTFTLACYANTAETARRVAERLTKLFTDDDARERDAEGVASRDLLQRQLDEARARLSEQEKKLEAYQLNFSQRSPQPADTGAKARNTTVRQLPALARADSRAGVGMLSSQGPELGVLARDYETDRRLYADLLARRDEALIAADLGGVAGSQRFKVLEAPRQPPGPESPNHRALYLIGFLAALLVGLGLAALLEYRDSSFRTEDDVADGLGMLVLATIAVLESHRSGISGQSEPTTSASRPPQSLARWRWS